MRKGGAWKSSPPPGFPHPPAADSFDPPQPPASQYLPEVTGWECLRDTSPEPNTWLAVDSDQGRGQQRARGSLQPHRAWGGIQLSSRGQACQRLFPLVLRGLLLPSRRSPPRGIQANLLQQSSGDTVESLCQGHFPDPRRVATPLEAANPNTPSELRSALGLPACLLWVSHAHLTPPPAHSWRGGPTSRNEAGLWTGLASRHPPPWGAQPWNPLSHGKIRRTAGARPEGPGAPVPEAGSKD